MATHVQRHVGHRARLILADHGRVRRPAVAAPAGQPATVPSPPDRHAPHHYPSDMGVFESARMSRELGRVMPLNSLQRQKSPNPILSALMNMSTRRFWVLVAGVASVVVGVLALRFPVFLPDFDQWGFQINCGSGISEHFDAGRRGRLGWSPVCRSVPHGHRDASCLEHPRGGVRSVAAGRTDD